MLLLSVDQRERDRACVHQTTAADAPFRSLPWSFLIKRYSAFVIVTRLMLLAATQQLTQRTGSFGLKIKL